jgi:hemerythrin superfamily protein
VTDVQISTAEDVVSFLKAQHEAIKALFERVAKAKGEQRKEEFVALRRVLAVHETAEEEVVHPRAKRELPNGERVVSARLKEENEAKQALARLEKLDVDSAEFDAAFEQLRADVIAHAEAEEHEEFPQLAAHLDDAQLERMRKAAQLAERMAPTRPHAGAESATANMLVGPFAAMVDRTRDVISGKH